MFKKFLLPVFALTVAMAQPAGRGPRAQSFEAIQTYLSLSDTQLESIRSSNKAAMESSKETFKSLFVKQKALREMVKNGTGDATAIGNATLEAEAIRKQLSAARTATHDKALSFLSAEQKTKLDALNGNRELRREMFQAQRLQLLAGNHGGPRGPGFRRQAK